MTYKTRKEKDWRSYYYWQFLKRNKNFQEDLRSLETELSKILDRRFEEKYDIRRRKGESIRSFVKRIIWRVLVVSGGEHHFLYAIKHKSLEHVWPHIPVQLPRAHGAPWVEDEFLAFYYFELLPKLYEFWEKWDVFYPYMYPPPIPEGRRAVSMKASGISLHPWTISLGIDLRKPKERIITELEYWIDFYKSEQVKVKMAGGKEPESFSTWGWGKKTREGRPPWRLFDRYLKVWDLKQQGKNFTEIAKILYPRLKGIDFSEPNNHLIRKLMRKQDELTRQGYSDDEAEEKAKKELGISTDKQRRRLRSAVNKVSNSYKRAKELINGGYKDL